MAASRHGSAFNRGVPACSGRSEAPRRLASPGVAQPHKTALIMPSLFFPLFRRQRDKNNITGFSPHPPPFPHSSKAVVDAATAGEPRWPCGLRPAWAGPRSPPQLLRTLSPYFNPSRPTPPNNRRATHARPGPLARRPSAAIIYKASSLYQLCSGKWSAFSIPQGCQQPRHYVISERQVAALRGRGAGGPGQVQAHPLGWPSQRPCLGHHRRSYPRHSRPATSTQPLASASLPTSFIEKTTNGSTSLLTAAFYPQPVRRGRVVDEMGVKGAGVKTRCPLLVGRRRDGKRL